MSNIQQAETPLSDHVAQFWKYLETETVRIMLDLKRTIGHDAPDGPTVYWDGATFSDDVAKALVAEYGPRARREPHKTMTAAEYAAVPIKGWHEVCRDIDGFGGVGIRYLPE